MPTVRRAGWASQRLVKHGESQTPAKENNQHDSGLEVSTPKAGAEGNAKPTEVFGGQEFTSVILMDSSMVTPDHHQTLRFLAKTTRYGQAQVGEIAESPGILAKI
jgi:hypothetical protein